MQLIVFNWLEALNSAYRKNRMGAVMHPVSRIGRARLLEAILAVRLLAPAAWTQTISEGGAVMGLVTDAQGRAVPGASVKLVDAATNLAQSILTNVTGRYLFVDMAPGSFNLTISKMGFAKAQVMAQQVEVGRTLTIDVTLELGSLQTTVEVQASARSGLQTANATLGTTMSFDSLLALPNSGRDASTLVELQPAVAPTGQAAGAVRDQNSFQLDGVNNNSDIDGTMNLYTVSYASNGGPTGVMPTQST